MPWTNVTSEDELAVGTRQVFNVDGREILLINHHGDIYAVGNRCPHMEARMERGEITEDGTIICPRHHSVFDLETGAVQEWVPWPPVVGRVLGAVSRHEALTVYPAKVQDGSVWVHVEESA